MVDLKKNSQIKWYTIFFHHLSLSQMIDYFPMPELNFKVKCTSICVFLMLFSIPATGQNTVGLISVDHDKSIGGYSLIYPEGQPHVFLINGCGEIVHIWEDGDNFRPGKMAYLLENGSLLRAKTSSGLGPSFGAGGSGGIVELLSWDNELEWSVTLADSLNRQHHDVLYMENGNVLMIVWEWKNYDEVIENGFDTLSSSVDALWPDYLLEINPLTDEKVWEWHAWDHLVQEFDSTKQNFGTVAEHPGLIDVNYRELFFERKDFMHSNAIDYDPIRDQVLLSVRNFNEIWVIDHSTTTEQAAGHSGGNSGSGGDLIFRWGNPAAFNGGGIEDQQLFHQHDAQWIDDFVNPDYEHFGKIVLYNNGLDNGATSLGQILEPVWDSSSNSYVQSDELYLPEGFDKTISHPDTCKNHSTAASSIQVIGDGNIVMCAARQGFSFELTDDGEVAWEYKVPLRFGTPIAQGTELLVNENFTFQLERYPEDFAGFFGKDLSPMGFIELEPNTSFCTVVADEEIIADHDFKIYPSPATDFFYIEAPFVGFKDIDIFDSYGRLVYARTFLEKQFNINITGWLPGLYFIKEKKSGVVGKILVR